MAVIYQISLHGNAFDARHLSWKSAIELSGCKPNLAWKDPIHNRSLLIGEFGCAVSHLRVWERIAESGINGIILEEDAVFTSIDPVDVSDKLRVYQSVWLGYRWNDLGYWYNAHAYAITPDTARHLCEGFSNSIIPVDEWLPYKLKERQNYFYVPEKVRQIPREDRPSTIEVGLMQVHVLTVGTDKTKMWALEQSSKRFGFNYLNLGEGVDWVGGTMEGEGGGQKINLVRGHLDSLNGNDNDIVLFMDGYDTFFADNMFTVLERFRGFDCDILFAAEKNCWPQASLAPQFPMTRSPYKYLNSGLYMGKVKALKSFFNTPIDEESDDQLWMQRRFLEPNGLNIQLDYEGYVFQCDDEIYVKANQMYNGMCCPCIYHGNGGSEAKKRFRLLAGEFGFFQETHSPVIKKVNLDYEEVAKDILVVPLLSSHECKNIIERAEAVGAWGEMQGDKFPAQEIRVKEFGLWDRIERLWSTHLGKIAEKKWTPMEYMGLRDAFTMRYSMDTQTSLGFHTDASLVTGSVKLNDDYEGAELIFPHQGFSNKDVPVGHCILFPSQVTHGHKVEPLRSGVKYSLTMWTSRYRGDVNE